MTKNKKLEPTIEAHFKDWNELSKRMKEIVVPALRNQDIEHQAIHSFKESHKALQRALEPIYTTQKIANQALRNIAFSQYTLPTKLAEQVEKFRNSIEGLISPAFENLLHSFRDLPPRTQEAILLLGRHGWYFDLNMDFFSLWDLRKSLEEGDIQKAENTLLHYFEDHLDYIESSIVQKFPNREKIIQPAFKAHRRKEYVLSIPVLLSQTDGICKEVVGDYFFLKKDKKPKTAQYVEQIAANTLRAALSSPLAHTLPISASESDRSADFNELNRHLVLHGDSLDYGTKTNSVKGISLINYIAQILKLDEFEP